MNRSKRYFFQVFLWAAIWSVGWLVLDGDFQFVRQNLVSYLLQVLVVAVLVYYTAPVLLLKKKYTYFILVSLVLLLVCSAVSSQIFQGPPPRRGALPNMRVQPPPRFLIEFLLLTIAYVLATIVETFLFAQKQEEETIRNKNENLQTELKLLKSQINPHFLFNSLNNIYALSVIDSNKTQQSISSLSDMLRYVLYECDRPFVPLHKEIDYIENYLNLFCLKSSKVFPITTDFTVLDRNVNIAPMLLIPFVENALKHGNLEKINNVFLTISVYSDSEEIKFEIVNSVPEAVLNKDKVGGIGLENVKKRLTLLYPKRHELIINNKSTTFEVKLHLNLDGED
ncbi:histidine kinase [uncultured Kriegella sp.]|uniref:sensor histidine kinase n=1 Tax=uncultured Kriegella sp. TaxID=1798910 RepID=UPI0030DAC1CB|tara:strand:+ start:117825 stop:118841 length:1017 start_codon:yes stop_codon:yes gene_type:complete